ncbi:MAG: redoxin family protein [Pyrinomonadaceae bacterium]|nr:redoxin family protein [Pyrinomonadaceae bacterium]
MEQSRLKNYLEMGSNAAVILVAAVILTIFGWHFLIRSPNSSPLVGLQKGQSLIQLPGYSYNSAPQTLVIALSSKCGYCSESIPFYNKLAELQNNPNKRTQLVAVFHTNDSGAVQFTQEKQLNINYITSVDFQALTIKSTPTMILVDSNGKVVDFWIGQLTEDKQQQIIKIITAT